MNGLEKFQIGRSSNFEKSQKAIVRAHYRKNPAGLTEFVELIQKFIQIMSVDPRPRPPLGHLEPWPQGTKPAGWELWKLEFKMPRLRGAAGQGRLIYLLNTAQKEVKLAWIYTHAEFEKRPTDKTLKSAIGEALESSEILGDRNNSAEEENGETAEKEAGEQ